MLFLVTSSISLRLLEAPLLIILLRKILEASSVAFCCDGTAVQSNFLPKLFTIYSHSSFFQGFRLSRGTGKNRNNAKKQRRNYVLVYEEFVALI